MWVTTTALTPAQWVPSSLIHDVFYRACPHVPAQCWGDWAWSQLSSGDRDQASHLKAASYRLRRQALRKSHPGWPNSTQANLKHEGASPRQTWNKDQAEQSCMSREGDSSSSPTGQLFPFSFQTTAWHWTPFISRLVWVSSPYSQRSNWHMVTILKFTCECL